MSLVCCTLSLDADRPHAVRVARAQPASKAIDSSASAGSRAAVASNSNSRAEALTAIIDRDIGPYPDLKPRLRLESSEWLKGAASTARRAPNDDLDGDGIPNSLDILLGAKKAVLLASPYVETYRVLAYPNGDMPRGEGVCTDVIVRALRNAGYDLQSLIQTDRRAAPAAYPAITKPDRNIDHRRVRNLIVYFRRHVPVVPVKKDTTAASYHPGDIVFFDTLGDSRPDHVGIVSDSLGPSKLPLVVNSWTTGYVTGEMDLLGSVRVTDHFRLR